MKNILAHLELGGICPTCDGEGSWMGGCGLVGCEDCGGTMGGIDEDSRRGSGEFVSDRGKRFLAWLMAEFEKHERELPTE